MTDSKDDDQTPLKLTAPRRLELKKTVGSGQVRQSFSRGRTKAVTVEVKKKRTISRGSDIFGTPEPREPERQRLLRSLPHRLSLRRRRRPPPLPRR